MASYQPGKASSFQNILSFAAAGVAYFFIAHQLFQFLCFVSLKTVGAPARFHPSGVHMYCLELEQYRKAPSRILIFWTHYYWAVLMGALVLAGWVLLKLRGVKQGIRKGLTGWLAILLITIPLYYSTQTIWLVAVMLKKNSLDDFWKNQPVTFSIWSMIFVAAVVIGIYVYKKLFNKPERKLLWLVSLPALIITFLGWFFVIAPMIAKHIL